MTIRVSFFNLLLLLFYFQTLALITSITHDEASLNSSNPIFLNADKPRRQQQFPHFLQDVLKEISVRQSWNLDDIRVSKLNPRKARLGRLKRYEFRLRIGKNDLFFKFSDEVASWKKLKNGRGGFESLINGVSSIPVLETFKLEGPFELRVDGDDELSLLLPLNTTHIGLRRILVGEGITVEVKGAREVSLFYTSDLDFPVNRSSVLKKKKSEFLPFWHSSCVALFPVHILGSSSLVAYRTRNLDAYIETSLLSKDTIELLPEKCYSRHNNNRKMTCPIDSLSSRIALLEKLLKSFLGNRIRQNGFLGSLKAKIKASEVIRIQLELKRHIRRNGNLHGTLAEWRTRSTVERIWFEIVARVEAGKLKPLLVKRVRPFIASDSIAWSNLMSNISFTKFPSFLVPPEALTLDVKWVLVCWICICEKWDENQEILRDVVKQRSIASVQVRGNLGYVCPWWCFVGWRMSGVEPSLCS